MIWPLASVAGERLGCCFVARWLSKDFSGTPLPPDRAVTSGCLKKTATEGVWLSPPNKMCLARQDLLKEILKKKQNKL